ncbi:acyl-CoA dehydrogenase, partial [Mycobacterium sp. E136]|uniref:acyl-CoA dehydrogenase family protein n=1 Tax=Mycobacterium sp. E136 TaxID=1834125 RepID=UPI0008000617
MDIGMTDEQEQLADAERAWLNRHDPIVKVRQALEQAPIRIDGDAVAHAEESGLLDLLTTEVGGTHMDLAVCAEAHGYAGSSLPIADLAVARWVLERAGADSDALTGVAQVKGVTTRPAPMAADMAQFIVVRGESVAVVDNPVLTELTTLDLTRSWARLTVDDAALEWRPLPAGTSERVRAALALHRGFDAIGAAARLLEMTVEYAGQREQFGAPIGSFQAVKHHCADMLVALEGARSLVAAAAEGDDDRAAELAAADAFDAAVEITEGAVQVHGGIGFTWEHPAHLLLRRARANAVLVE